MNIITSQEMASTGKMIMAWVIGVVLAALPQATALGEVLELVSLCVGILFLILSCVLVLIRIFNEKSNKDVKKD